jgi:hypothetical protein
MHDDGRQMIVTDHCFHDPLGDDLALLVGANRTGFGQTHRHVGLPAIRRAGDGRHTARPYDCWA